MDPAARTALQADLAIIVAGYTFNDEGEFVQGMLFFPAKGDDRDSLALKPHDESLIQAIAAANPNTIVVMMGGSAIITEASRLQVPAVLVTWYPGMEGGHAIADILFGQVSPSANLPCTFPQSADQLSFFDKDAETIEYGYFHGYRLLEHQGHQPAYPLGFVLSYTTFFIRICRSNRSNQGPRIRSP